MHFPKFKHTAKNYYDTTKLYIGFLFNVFIPQILRINVHQANLGTTQKDHNPLSSEAEKVIKKYKQLKKWKIMDFGFWLGLKSGSNT